MKNDVQAQVMFAHSRLGMCLLEINGLNANVTLSFGYIASVECLLTGWMVVAGRTGGKVAAVGHSFQLHEMSFNLNLFTTS